MRRRGPLRNRPEREARCDGNAEVVVERGAAGGVRDALGVWLVAHGCAFGRKRCLERVRRDVKRARREGQRGRR